MTRFEITRPIIRPLLFSDHRLARVCCLSRIYRSKDKFLARAVYMFRRRVEILEKLFNCAYISQLLKQLPEKGGIRGTR